MRVFAVSTSLMLVLLLHSTVLADMTLTTKDGKQILLKDNGTWEYLQSSSAELPRSTTYNFRKTRWGMTRNEVKASESNKLEKESDDVLVFSGKVAGKDALIVYRFAGNKLALGRYVFMLEHTNKNDYIVDFKNVQQTLKEKYGAPLKDEVTWLNNLYRNDPQDYGTAISIGHLMYMSNWSAEGTEIYLGLSGENFKIKLVTEYSSIELEPLLQKKTKEKIQADF
jgi:hypothetical protein